ncbi:chromate transporter [Rhodobacterales bacterium LSUCC0031]|nr:chromate transporter [Rhodobacterales bacterium LSUCC0031]
MVGVTGFGGVLPVFVHEVVRKRAWLRDDEFAELLAVCQVLPGPNIVNMSMVLGMRTCGLSGAFVSVLGLLLLPVALVLALGALYASFAHLPAVEGAVRAIAAAAAGLLIAITARLFWPQRANPVAILIGLMVLIAIAWLRLPLIWVLTFLGPVSVALTWWRRRGHG